MSVVSHFTKPARGGHELIIPNETGHAAMTWEPGTASVDQVREEFDAIIKAGYTAYAEAPDGELSVIRDFDETATRIVVSAPLVGG